MSDEDNNLHSVEEFFRTNQDKDTIQEDKIESELKLILYRTWAEEYADKKIIRKYKNLKRQCKKLEREGKIAEFKELPEQSRVSIDARREVNTADKQRIERFDEYQQWAQRAELNIRSYFQEKETKDGKWIVLPDVFLVVRKSANVRGVFPCSDGTTEYAIEDYLDALEQETDWQLNDDTTGLTSPDYGIHGTIKAHLYQNPSDTVGEEWVKPEDEMTVVGGIYTEEQGRIDLYFKHQTKEQYLLVEVKPAKQEVDSAFGQVLRYRYEFLQDRALPHLEPQDIQLAIAAPEFYESHRLAAEKIGIELIQAPVSV